MSGFLSLTKRNIKMFFKDKGMFFSSLITPIILLVLYVTFLGGVYRDSFGSNLPEGVEIDKGLVNGLVGGELFSSLLAVCCVTVAFCSNMLMVQDRVNGAIGDLSMAPVKKSVFAMSYFTSAAASTLIISVTALSVSMIYLAVKGWYLSVADVFLILLDVTLLSLFGTALSSIINCFLTSQGQISAVGTIVSAGYGFLCGAYMPMSSFGAGLQKVLSFMPGTYGTSLIRNHAMGGVIRELSLIGVPQEVITGIRDSVDCNLYFFGKSVSTGAMYLVLTLSIAALVGVYILINILQKKKKA